MRPLTGGRRPSSDSTSVVLPAPFGPITATRWPRSTTRPASSSSGLSPARSVSALGLDHDAPAALDLREAERERPVAARRLDALACAAIALDPRLRLARARAGAELVDEALQPLDLGLLALEGVGLLRERERLLAAVGGVAHRVVLAAAELELEHAGRHGLQEPAVVRDQQDRARRAT